MQTLDLQGVSGSTYRFRQVTAPSDLPAHAGNFVVAKAAETGARVLVCGSRRSLTELQGLWADLTADGGEIYVRLNVGRSVRLAEYDDLVAALDPADRLPEPN